jgi:hypothetical protein
MGAESSGGFSPQGKPKFGERLLAPRSTPSIHAGQFWESLIY